MNLCATYPANYQNATGRDSKKRLCRSASYSPRVLINIQTIDRRFVYRSQCLEMKKCSAGMIMRDMIVDEISPPIITHASGE